MAKNQRWDIKTKLSMQRYRELLYFCMQYQEKKKELEGSYGLSAVNNNGMPSGNKIGHPTEEQAIRNEQLAHEIKIIEDCAEAADQEIKSWIILNVTEGISYEYLGPPAGRSKFYRARRKFFYLLDKKR